MKDKKNQESPDTGGSCEQGCEGCPGVCKARGPPTVVAD